MPGSAVRALFCFRNAGWCLFLAGVVLGAAGRAHAREKLVPANFQKHRDALGFEWDVQQHGTIGDGSNDCFDGAVALSVNGTNFQPQTSQMTSSGIEYVLERKNLNGFDVTRRILLDTKRSVVRYIESFHNPQSAPRQLQAQLSTTLGSSCAQTITTSGQVFSGALGKKDVGLLTISNTQRPCVLFLLGDHRSGHQPAVNIRSQRHYQFNYTINVKPGKTATLVHLMAQRRGVTPASVAQIVKPLYRRRLIQPEIPRALRRTVVNFSVGGWASLQPGAPLQPLLALLENLGVERGEQDVLVTGEETRLRGRLMSEPWTVKTRHGTVEVAPDAVGMLCGGAGEGRPMRTFLRNGEILLGPVESHGLRFSTSDGVMVRLEPASVHMFVRAKQGDGKGVAPEHAVAYLETHEGERLALAGQEDLRIPAALPWGTAEFPLQAIECLTYVRNGQPGYRVALTDGSRLRVLLRGEALTVRTLRFGPIQLYPQAIARVVCIKRPKPKTPAKTKGTTTHGDDGIPEAMAKKLATKVTLRFDDTSVPEALKLFAEQVRVPTRLAKVEQEAPEIGEIRLTLQIKDMLARKALAWIKELSGLDYHIGPSGIVFGREDASDPEPEAETEDPAKIRAPHFRLVGDSRLVGRFAEGELSFIAMNGPVTIQPEQLRRLERRDGEDVERWPFAVSLNDGGRLKGRLPHRVIQVKALDGIYRIPLQHVQGFVNPEARSAASEPPSDRAPDGPPADW